MDHFDKENSLICNCSFLFFTISEAQSLSISILTSQMQSKDSFN